MAATTETEGACDADQTVSAGTDSYAGLPIDPDPDPEWDWDSDPEREQELPEDPYPDGHLSMARYPSRAA